MAEEKAYIAAAVTTTEYQSLLLLLTEIKSDLKHALARGEDHEARIRELEDRRTVSPAQLWTVTASGVATLGVIVGLVSKVIGG